MEIVRDGAVFSAVTASGESRTISLPSLVANVNLLGACRKTTNIVRFDRLAGSLAFGINQLALHHNVEHSRPAGPTFTLLFGQSDRATPPPSFSSACLQPYMAHIPISPNQSLTAHYAAFISHNGRCYNATSCLFSSLDTARLPPSQVAIFKLACC